MRLSAAVLAAAAIQAVSAATAEEWRSRSIYQCVPNCYSDETMAPRRASRSPSSLVFFWAVIVSRLGGPRGLVLPVARGFRARCGRQPARGTDTACLVVGTHDRQQQQRHGHAHDPRWCKERKERKERGEPAVAAATPPRHAARAQGALFCSVVFPCICCMRLTLSLQDHYGPFRARVRHGPRAHLAAARRL